MPYRLFVKDTGQPIANISEEQLQTLVDLLEEEDADDRDYYVDGAVLDYLADRGADPALLSLLRSVLPPGGGVEVEWTAA
ncbi:MAG TPA: galactosyldiacylglycerol synthase [Chloroflexota bacterium]|nr:galactosyldiacylglycerol synthase [Chloroflexota bacterium]